MMKAKGLVVVIGVLLLSTVAMGMDPTIPLLDRGNLYDTVGNTAQMGFNRIAWCQWPDPVFPAWTWEYRCDRTSHRFTADGSGTVQAIQWYTRTEAAKAGQNAPTMTFTVETDDGSGKPSGTVLGTGTGTYTELMATTGGYTGKLTMPMSTPPTLTAGTAYHVVMKCDSLVAPSVIANGADYANSLYDFRLHCGTSSSPITQVDTYTGEVDSNIMTLYYNQTAGGQYENTWREASPGEVIMGGGDGEKASQKGPLFEMFANYDPGTQTVSNPIAGLGQGYNIGYIEGGSSASGTEKGRPIADNNDAVGEKIVAHYPNAVPVAKKAKVFIRKQTAHGSPPDPDGDVLIEVRDSTNTVVASGTYPTASIPFDDKYMWVEVELNTDVVLTDGQTYYVSARSPNLTVGRYRVGAHSDDTDTLLVSQANGFYGIEAVLVEDYATSGATWTEQSARDISFGLSIVIPGDANGDHNVNVGDLGILAANYGQSPRDWATADFNSDTTVNVGDLGILAAHYGEHLPEPATMGLLVFGGIALLRRRRH